MTHPESTPIPINNVLFATDFSPTAENAFSYALTIADRYGSKLYVAHAIDTESFDLLESGEIQSVVEKARNAAVNRIGAFLKLKGLPADRCEIVVAGGVVFEVLVDVIERHGIDLAVLGTHGRRAFKKLTMGSIAEEVFRMSPCPVLTVGSQVRPADGRGPQHILYPLQFFPDTSKAARYAVSLAERYAASLTVMHVEGDPLLPGMTSEPSTPFENWLRDHVAQGSLLPSRTRFESRSGAAADAIVDFAAKTAVGLIVMPIRQLDALIAAHLPGSDTTYELVSRAPCPVLTTAEM